MKRIFIIGLLFLYAFTLYSQSNIRYYFKTLDIQDGLSQNTVNAILKINKVSCGLEQRWFESF